jgi:hypothetical protein
MLARMCGSWAKMKGDASSATKNSISQLFQLSKYKPEVVPNLEIFRV